jgi:hypothetical protein
MSDALCATTDPEAFLPKKGGSTARAKAICAQCDVQAQCLEYALQNGPVQGVWGGTSERERRDMKRSGESARTRLDYVRIADLVKNGLSDSDVADRVGCSVESVGRWRRANGVAANVYRRVA